MKSATSNVPTSLMTTRARGDESRRSSAGEGGEAKGRLRRDQTPLAAGVTLHRFGMGQDPSAVFAAKPGAPSDVLWDVEVDTARAQLVDAAALVQALREGWIAGAGLDVFVEEPLPLDDVLRRLPNVLATPHLGYVTRDNYRLYYREVVEDIRAFLAGAPLRRLD